MKKKKIFKLIKKALNGAEVTPVSKEIEIGPIKVDHLTHYDVKISSEKMEAMFDLVIEAIKFENRRKEPKNGRF